MKLLKALLLGLLVASSVSAQQVVSDGITLTIPSSGQKNWYDLFLNNFTKPISGHDHTGAGKGLQIGTTAFANDAVTAAKVRLANDTYLRARNAANSADLSLIKANASNKIIFDIANVDATTRTSLGAAASGANSDITSLTGLTWTNYTPTTSGDGTNTWTLSSITRGKQFNAGKFVCVSIEFVGTLSATLSDKVTVTLPFNSQPPDGGNMAVNMTIPGGTIISGSAIFSNPNTFQLRRFDGTNLANGAYTFRVNGCYERS